MSALTMLKISGSNYRQGVSQTQPKRCSTCAHRADGRKQHGLTCTLYGATCKTHGVCDWWASTKPVEAK